MFSRAINRDLAHLEGKGGFSLDRLMIILCYDRPDHRGHPSRIHDSLLRVLGRNKD
jgi:hypothetical protein